jgi:hypothetical protein
MKVQATPEPTLDGTQAAIMFTGDATILGAGGIKFEFGVGIM